MISTAKFEQHSLEKDYTTLSSIVKNLLVTLNSGINNRKR